MAALDPPPHFPLTSVAQGDDERHVARILVGSREVAAVLDGLAITDGGGHYAQPLTELLAAAIHSMTLSMASDIGDDGWAATVSGAADLSATATRLPLATRLLHQRMVAAECNPSMAERDGWHAEVRELLVGKIPGFRISGPERDALVQEVHARLERNGPPTDDDERRWEWELNAILQDTGKKRETGEGCTLTSLPMPELVEWLRRFGPDVSSQDSPRPSKKQRKALRKRSDLIRDMWVRLGIEIKAGPKEVS